MLAVATITVAGSASTQVQKALAAIEQGAEASHTDALLVMRGDEVLFESYASGVPEPIELMSVTKSVVALAIGALLSDGKLASLDMPVADFYPEWRQGRKSAITVRMLMDHSSGIQNVPRPSEEIYSAPDVIKLALAAELSHDPGAHWAYNNKAVNLLAGIILKASGMPMDSYIQQRLFAPLSITQDGWYKDAAGNPHAMAGLSLTARDIAKIGHLVLARGQFRAKSLIGPGYIDAMLAHSTLTPDVGLLWWRRPGGVHFRVDKESIAMLEGVNADPHMIDKLRPLQGRSFASQLDLYAVLAERLGAGWGEQWNRELIEPHGIGPWRPFHPEKKPVDTYEANGSFGQYLVIIPKASLVAVRQIKASPDTERDSEYQDFTSRIQALAVAFAEAEKAP
ncbi:MAG: serine hydrolase [Xanthomonadaceae bacterium]|nr:serine hydrolase [Xanthomonadaceae bacterium]